MLWWAGWCFPKMAYFIYIYLHASDQSMSKNFIKQKKNIYNFINSSWCLDWHFLGELGQYHVYWCPGSLSPGHQQLWHLLCRIHQSSYSMSKDLISMSRNDRKCKYILVILRSNTVCYELNQFSVHSVDLSSWPNQSPTNFILTLIYKHWATQGKFIWSRPSAAAFMNK